MSFCLESMSNFSDNIFLAFGLIPEKYKCDHCCRVLEDPLYCCTEKHSFCTSCVRIQTVCKCLVNGNGMFHKCPEFVSEFISNLKVQCTEKIDELHLCSWTGELRAWKVHVAAHRQVASSDLEIAGGEQSVHHDEVTVDSLKSSQVIFEETAITTFRGRDATAGNVHGSDRSPVDAHAFG